MTSKDSKRKAKGASDQANLDVTVLLQDAFANPGEESPFLASGLLDGCSAGLPPPSSSSPAPGTFFTNAATNAARAVEMRQLKRKLAELQEEQARGRVQVPVAAPPPDYGYSNR